MRKRSLLIRIAKLIARAGLCSRREAERWIIEQRVTVDGGLITSPALNVSENQEIRVDGKPLPKISETELWVFHKPKGFLTTHNDPEDRPTIFSILPKNLAHFKTVGRLDLNSEGLLLLTNDGELKRKLELPSSGIIREYRVRAYGKLDLKKLESLKKGIKIKDDKTGNEITYKAFDAIHENTSGDNHWLLIKLKTGKNREIRKLCEHIGLKVNRLIRISYGNIKLGTLTAGEAKKISILTLGSII